MMLVFLDPRNRKFWSLLLLETSHLLNHTFLVAIDKAERFKKISKKEKKVDKTLARNHKMLYNIIIKVKEKQVITSYEGRGKSPIKTKIILKILFSYPYLHIKLSPQEEKHHVKINREGIYKSYTLTSTPCLVFTGGNLTIVPQSQYRGNAIIPIGTLLLPRTRIVKDEGYFYEVELTKKGSQEAQNERLTDKEYKYQSEENKGLEDELKGQSEEEKKRKREWFSHKIDGFAVT